MWLKIHQHHNTIHSDHVVILIVTMVSLVSVTTKCRPDKFYFLPNTGYVQQVEIEVRDVKYKNRQIVNI